MKRFNKYWWMAFLPLMALPWLWLHGNQIILAVDFPFPLSGKLVFMRSFFPWDHIDNLGSVFGAQFYPSRLLIHSFQYLLELAHGNAEKIFLGLSLFLPAISLGHLTNELLFDVDAPAQKLGSIVAGYFAALNLYLLVQILDPAMVLQLIFVPMILMLSFKATRIKRYTYYGLAAALSTIGLSFLNPSSSATGIFLIGFVWTIGIIKKLRKHDWAGLKGFCGFIGITLIGGAILNLWWLLPFLISLQSFVTNTAIPTISWLIGTSQDTSFINVIRLIGAWDWFSQFNGEAYVPYASQYIHMSALALLATLPAILALIGYLKRPHRVFSIFAWIACIGIFLAIGSHGMTGTLFLMLYRFVPGFWLFRSPWYKFSMWIVIGFAPLIGAAAIWLAQRTRLPKWSIAMLCIGLFSIISHPLITGARFVAQQPGKTLSVNILNMPSYVYDSANFLNTKNDYGRVLMLPQLFYDTTKYTWGFGSLRPPLSDLVTNHPLVYRFIDQQFDFTTQLNVLRDSLRAGDRAKARQITTMLGIRYVLNQKDFDTKFFANDPSQNDLERYVQLLGGSKVFESGNWQLYDLGDTNQAASLDGLTISETFNDRFTQPFPANTAYAPQAPQQLAERSGAITQVTRNTIEQTKGLLSASFHAPSAGTYQIIGSVPSGITINGEVIKPNQSTELRLDNQIAIASLTQPVALPNGDFTHDLANWRVQNLALYADKSLARGVTIAKDHGGAADLMAHGDWIALTRRLPDINANALILSLDIDAPATGRFELAIDRPDEHKTYPVPINLTAGSHHYDLIIDGATVKAPADLYFYLYPSNNESTEHAYINHIALHTLAEPLSIYLVKQPVPFEQSSWQYERVSPTHIKLTTDKPIPQLIEVKEHYDPRWQLRSGNFVAQPIKVNNATMAFYIDKPGLQQFDLEYTLTRQYWAAIAVSATTFIALLVALIFLSKKRGAA